MIDPSNVPEVTDEETLARFVLHSRQIRSDQTVKQDAFIPHPHKDLSVTRHLHASEAELWGIGNNVAKAQGKKLYGRADLLARMCRSQSLLVKPTPLDGNPNHADISGWPAAKQDQKAIALKLAASARFIPYMEVS